MNNWRDELISKVNTIEHSNSLDTADKIINFFEVEFRELTTHFLNEEDVSNIETLEDGVYFFIYKRYFTLKLNETKNEMDVYVPEQDGMRKYVTIFINKEEETYAKFETDSQNSKHYIDENFANQIFMRTYRNISKES